MKIENKFKDKNGKFKNIPEGKFEIEKKIEITIWIEKKIKIEKELKWKKIKIE